MEAYIRFVIRNRVLVLVGVCLVTVVGGYQMSKGVVATSLTSLILGESPEYQRYLGRVEEFGGDGIIAIAFEEDELFSPESLRRLRAVVALVEAHPEIARVQSVLDARRIAGDGGKLNIISYAKEAEADPGTASEVLAELLGDPLAKGRYVSGDGGHTLVLAELVHDENRPVEKEPQVVDEIVELFAESGYDREELHLAGIIPVMAEVVDQTFLNITRISPVVMLLLLVVVFIMFRRLWPVVITGGAGFVAVVWTMGFAVTLDSQISILMAMAPAVIMIVSFSDVIHLCSAYLLELSRGQSKDEAILVSGTEVGKACLFTSLTTLAGFLSLSLVPAPVFRQMGFVLGFGVAVALLLAMTLAPILFSLMKEPKPWRTGTASRVQSGLDRFLIAVERFVKGRPWTTVLLFAAGTAVALVGVFQMSIDTSFSDRLDEDNPIRVDERYFEEHFDGTSTLELYVRTGKREGILDPDLFAAVAAFEDEVEQLPDVDNVISLVDVLRTVHRAIASPEKRKQDPDNRKLLAQYLLLLEMSSDGYELKQLVNFDRETMRLLVLMPEMPVRQVSALGNRAMELGGSIRNAGSQLETTGSLYLMGNWLDNIIWGQRAGLATAFLTVALMMIIGLASVRVGLWSMIPNALPILALGGYIGLAWDKVDSDVMAIGMIAVGIGVDDTIHFLMRFKLECERDQPVDQALRNTFHFAGRAIVITSVVLVVGFLPFAMSDYFPLHIMGTLLPMCLIVALVADLMLVPALVKLGVLRFKKRGPKTAVSGIGKRRL